MRVLSLVLVGAATAFGLDCPQHQYKTLNLHSNETGLIHNTRILYPSAPGAYPAFTFLHGFALDIISYDEVLCVAATKSIVILFQMKFRLITEGLQEDAEMLMPYLHDPKRGILPRLGTFLRGYSYTGLGVGGHSRGGGVIAHAYSNGLVTDADFSGVAFIDPVVIRPAKDVPDTVHLVRTKVRTVFFNDPASICVIHGWPDAIGERIQAMNRKVTNASECHHMDVLSNWGSVLPLCHSHNGDQCKRTARDIIAESDFWANDIIAV